MAQKNSVRGAEASLRGGELDVVLAQAFEEGSYRLDAGRRMRVEDDHILEVGRHLCQTFDDFVDRVFRAGVFLDCLFVCLFVCLCFLGLGWGWFSRILSCPPPPPAQCRGW